MNSNLFILKEQYLATGKKKLSGILKKGLAAFSSHKTKKISAKHETLGQAKAAKVLLVKQVQTGSK